MASFHLPLLCGLLLVCLAGAVHNITLKYANILDKLRENSDPDVIPIDEKDPQPVQVRLEQSLLYILKADSTADTLELVVRQRMTWRNADLNWDQTNPHMNVENVTIPVRYLWVPDLIPTSVVNMPEQLSPELARVSSDGEIIYEPIYRLVLHADLSGLSNPTGANVTFNFQSWTNDNSRLTLQTPTDSCFRIDEFESRRFKVSEALVIKYVNQTTSSLTNVDALSFSFILKNAS